ncbi:hypothetical protein ES708_04220 [subsurface metagenome]
MNELKATKDMLQLRKDMLQLRQGVDYLITCPHCKGLIGQIIPKNETVEVALYTGNCVDCKFLDMLPKEEIIEFEGNKLIAMCGINGNVNPIHFTKKDLEDKKNWIADNCGIKEKTADDPSGHKYHCYAFKRRDKKIDLDKL